MKQSKFCLQCYFLFRSRPKLYKNGYQIFFHQNYDIEDEYYIKLIRPIYRDLRTKFIKKYYWNNPFVYKFAQLLRANNVRDRCNLVKYVKRALKIRTFNSEYL